MPKTDDEILCIRTAVAVAEASLSAAIAALHPGMRERELLGAFVERMGDFGLTTLAMEGIFTATEPHHDGQPLRLRRVASDRAVDEGALVALCGGVMFAGYEGSLGRTHPCLGRGHRAATAAQRDLHGRWNRIWHHLADACQPGNTGADLRAAYEASGEPLPPFPIAQSVGIGVEAPIAGSGLGAEFDAQWQLQPGMVLQLAAYTAGSPGGVFGMETVLIHDNGHEVLSTLSHGPLAASG
jgi:Xaa-Pro aminopeptidase